MKMAISKLKHEVEILKRVALPRGKSRIESYEKAIKELERIELKSSKND